MDIKRDKWKTSEALTRQEREILFITAEAAGMRVFPTTRMFINGDKYSYIGHDGDSISGVSYPAHPGQDKDNIVAIKRWEGMFIMSYEEILEELRTIIKNNSEYKCF